MANIDSVTGGKRKFKPASRRATPKICGAQIIKGREQKLEALNVTEYKNNMPKEIAEGVTIKLFADQRERA